MYVPSVPIASQEQMIVKFLIFLIMSFHLSESFFRLVFTITSQSGFTAYNSSKNSKYPFMYVGSPPARYTFLSIFLSILFRYSLFWLLTAIFIPFSFCHNVLSWGPQVLHFKLHVGSYRTSTYSNFGSSISGSPNFAIQSLVSCILALKPD